MRTLCTAMLGSHARVRQLWKRRQRRRRCQILPRYSQPYFSAQRPPHRLSHNLFRATVQCANRSDHRLNLMGRNHGSIAWSRHCRPRRCVPAASVRTPPTPPPPARSVQDQAAAGAPHSPPPATAPGSSAPTDIGVAPASTHATAATRPEHLSAERALLALAAGWPG